MTGLVSATKMFVIFVKSHRANTELNAAQKALINIPNIKYPNIFVSPIKPAKAALSKPKLIVFSSRKNGYFTRRENTNSHSPKITASKAEVKQAQALTAPYTRLEHRTMESRKKRFSQSAQNKVAPGMAANSRYRTQKFT